MTTTTHRRRPASEGGYTCGDETSLRIIEAALTLFGERGFEGASTRDIAELAGVNAPALNYYFKNKEGVYLACAEYMVERTCDYLAPTIEAAQALLGTRPDTEQLIESFCTVQGKIGEFMLVSNRTHNWRKFYAREQAGLGPNSGAQMISQRIGQRIIGVTSGIISRLIGPTASDEECILRAMSLTGQLLPFHLNRAKSLSSLDWDAITPERYALLIGIVREQTVAVLRGLVRA
ncbi:CerR family C-terminal domain-containing protein [Pseudomonas sp. NPDC096917]|uniref:CerR family C-terminal domain-containing protein n=1 Tax=Pseudomonas sp. NPDC096917 TaxID=3364483 RepID=UPI00383B74F9